MRGGAGMLNWWGASLAAASTFYGWCCILPNNPAPLANTSVWGACQNIKVSGGWNDRRCQLNIRCVDSTRGQVKEGCYGEAAGK